jgi:hypothetical protein
MSRDLTAPTMTIDHELRAKRPTFPPFNDPRAWAGRELTDVETVDAEDGFHGWRRRSA